MIQKEDTEVELKFPPGDEKNGIFEILTILTTLFKRDVAIQERLE